MFQTRDESGGIQEFNTFAEAYEAAKNDPNIWKISFAVGNERIRLVRFNDPQQKTQFMVEQMYYRNGIYKTF